MPWPMRSAPAVMAELDVAQQLAHFDVAAGKLFASVDGDVLHARWHRAGGQFALHAGVLRPVRRDLGDGLAQRAHPGGEIRHRCGGQVRWQRLRLGFDSLAPGGLFGQHLLEQAGSFRTQGVVAQHPRRRRRGVQQRAQPPGQDTVIHGVGRQAGVCHHPQTLERFQPRLVEPDHVGAGQVGKHLLEQDLVLFPGGSAEHAAGAGDDAAGSAGDGVGGRQALAGADLQAARTASDEPGRMAGRPSVRKVPVMRL